jgi:aryl-alcohol dehydrogenase-like predicted oxidoreductase
MQHITFNDHELSRVFKGNWQLAGGHGDIPRAQALEDMFTYVEHGVNVFDVGDIYTGAEELVGEFLASYSQRYGKEAASQLRVHTKYVPDLNALENLTEADTRAIIERSLKRLGLDSLHLVQFHWWDFAKGDYVKAGLYLEKLRQEGLIDTIGLTNFDVEHTQKLLDAGVSVKSNQIQFSLLDPRPLNGMLDFARQNDIAIFCYGSLAGGLLGGARPGHEPNNRSHTKYQLMIEEASEQHYQKVVHLLADIAIEHETTPANIAVAFVLQTPGVSAAILGPRNAKHINELDDLSLIRLEENEYNKLRGTLEAVRPKLPDDIYSLERDITGPHGRIMKYNLNGMRAATHGETNGS